MGYILHGNVCLVELKFNYIRSLCIYSYFLRLKCGDKAVQKLGKSKIDIILARNSVHLCLLYLHVNEFNSQGRFFKF